MPNNIGVKITKANLCRNELAAPLTMSYNTEQDTQNIYDILINITEM